MTPCQSNSRPDDSSGKECGLGSSRDWAAKGVMLLGMKAVIAEGFERIHRTNLVGMGVLPLQFQAPQNAGSLGLTGTETFHIDGVNAAMETAGQRLLTVPHEQSSFCV